MRKMLIVAASLLSFSILNGQYNTIVPSSPVTSTLNKFIDFPLDYSTGTADISIPLFEIKMKDFSIPWSMSFNARGRMAKLDFSPLGVGWAFSNLSYISRQIRGWPDELCGYKRFEMSKFDLLNVNRSSTEYNNQFRDLYSKIISAEPALTDRMSTYINPGTYWDGENDIFTYTIHGESGKFIKDRDEKVVPLTYTTLRFPAAAGSGAAIYDVSDDKGNKYTFGDDLNAVEEADMKVSDISSVDRFWTALYLKEIVTASFDTIKYSYERVSTQSNSAIKPSTVGFTVYEAKMRIGIGGWTPPGFPIQDGGGALQSDFITTSRNYQVCLLTGIQFSGGKVTFTYDNLTKKINSISVFNSSQVLVKRIEFSYANTIGGTELSNNNGISLTSVKFYDSGGQSGGEYNFEYYENPLPFTTPNHDLEFTNNSDWWGYSNSGGSRPPAISTDPNFYSGCNGCKDANELVKLNGMLKKIRYPAGGSTEFIYENNKFYNGVSRTNEFGPGLRIKEISSTDLAGNKITKIIKYGVGEDGVGTLSFVPFPEDYRRQQLYQAWSEADGSVDYVVKTYSPFPVDYMSEMYSLPVFYREVTEYQVDSSGVPNGKTVFKYMDPDYTYGSNFESGRYGVIKDWTKSQLLEQSVFSYNSGSFVLQQRKSTSFKILNHRVIPQVPLRRYKTIWFYKNWTPSGYTLVLDGTGTFHEEEYLRDIDYRGIEGVWEFVDRPIESAIYVKNDESITQFTSDGKQVTSTTAYSEYNTGNALPYKMITNRSDGKVSIQRLKYSNDFYTGPFNNMVTEKNMTGVILEKADSIDGSFVKLFKTNYFNPQPGIYVPQNLQEQNKGESGLSTTFLFNHYDTHGNILEQQKADDVKEVYLWGYYGQYPVVKVIGSDLATVLQHIDTTQIGNITNSTTLTGEQVDAQLRALVGSLRTWFSNNPLVQVSVYTYKPLIGMTSETDASGRTIYYEYDGFGRLKLVKDDQGKVLKTICYNYQGQQVDCL
jgi:YD repeat-containing protein